jgi:predicted GNAT superfamily acetyltransferase
MKSEKFLTFVGKNRAGRGIARLIYKSFFHFLWCFLRLPSKVGSSTLLTRSTSSAGHSAANFAWRCASYLNQRFFREQILDTLNV